MRTSSNVCEDCAKKSGRWSYIGLNRTGGAVYSFTKGGTINIPNAPVLPELNDIVPKYLQETDRLLKEYDAAAASIEAAALASQNQGKLFPRDLKDMRDNVRLTRTVLQDFRSKSRITPNTYEGAIAEFNKVAAGGLQRTRNLITAFESQLCIPMRQQYCESYMEPNKCPAPCEQPGRFRKFIGSKPCIYPSTLVSAAPKYDKTAQGAMPHCPASSYPKI